MSFLLLLATVLAQAPAPTYEDVAYGPHERQRIDFWKAESARPAPVVLLIHGGGFVNGDKTQFRKGGLIPALLAKGVSCAAINYRFRKHAPLQDILGDTARALQHIRWKAKEWNVDAARVACSGGSAGAGSCLYLATRDDRADPKSADPVARQSTRLKAAVLNATQATYDFQRWESFLGPAKPEWIQPPDEFYRIYGFPSAAELDTAEGKAVRRECDMLAWISKDDAPLLCVVNQPDGPAQNRGHWLHHPKHAEAIRAECERVGIECAVTREKGASGAAFLLKHLGVE
jgi:acetyl esterase/lipase